MWAILTCPPNMHRSFVSRTMSLYQDWDSVCTLYKHYKASHVARLAHYMYQDSMLLAPVSYFAELVLTGLWDACAEPDKL